MCWLGNGDTQVRTLAPIPKPLGLLWVCNTNSWFDPKPRNRISIWSSHKPLQIAFSFSVALSFWIQQSTHVRNYHRYQGICKTRKLSLWISEVFKNKYIFFWNIWESRPTSLTTFAGGAAWNATDKWKTFPEAERNERNENTGGIEESGLEQKVFLSFRLKGSCFTFLITREKLGLSNHDFPVWEEGRENIMGLYYAVFFFHAESFIWYL